MRLRQTFLAAMYATFLAASTASAAPTHEQLAQLETQITYAEDLSAIKRLQRAYGYYLDKGLWENLANLFAQDAVANYPAGIYIGYDSIHAHLLKNVGPGRLGLSEGQLYNHMILQPVVHLAADGQSAKGRWRAFAMMGRYGRAANWVEGVYEITYVKDQGAWKIRTLDYHSGFGASYEGGWAKARATPPAGASSEGSSPAPRRPPLAHPPDKPRNEPCPGYPQACVAPFHYANPVTGGGGAAWPSEVASMKKGRAKLADLAQRAALLHS